MARQVMVSPYHRSPRHSPFDRGLASNVVVTNRTGQDYLLAATCVAAEDCVASYQFPCRTLEVQVSMSSGKDLCRGVIVGHP